jgi:UDP-N-acetylmuramoyl-L-alanyl-D-glutamate--2,6-diaminopimelate ligase
MPYLHDILYKVGIRSVMGSTAVEVGSLHIDSREVEPGGCFIAIRGAHSDGHAYIRDALAKGAVAVICENMPDEMPGGVTFVRVEDGAEAAGVTAHEFYGRPSEKLLLTGVTGTNGKTTIATLLYKLFTGLDHTCGLISTVENRIGEDTLPATHTTPDAVSLNRLLSRMVDAGCTHAFMECSSHAIHQRRIAGLRFKGAIFSNITHDHLDYHKTFDEYIRVKKSLFDGLPADAFAISNLDDRRGTVMLQNTPADKFYYSLRSISDFRGRVLENAITGLQMVVNEQEVQFRLIGEFNAYNLLAVYAAAVCLGEERQEVLRVMSGLTGAEGRFEVMVSPRTRVVGIVDYAHTPDALANVLSTIRRLRSGGERIITVVGCGGDRDSAKRPLMGEVACTQSDRAVFTSDNPRSEDPAAIMEEMRAGLTAAQLRKLICIADRREAIRTAVTLADTDDIVLVAGKGHERYQEVAGVRKPFDDKEVLASMFRELEK